MRVGERDSRKRLPRMGLWGSLPDWTKVVVIGAIIALCMGFVDWVWRTITQLLKRSHESADDKGKPLPTQRKTPKGDGG